MTRHSRDERAVRGAAEVAAGMYRWAVLGLAALAALTLTRFEWYKALPEMAALAAGCGLVLIRRIRSGLWGRLDEPMKELLTLARAKAFDVMGWTSVVAMLLGFILDDGIFLYQTPCLLLSLMRSHVQDRCIREGWLHGLLPRSPKGRAAIVRAVVIFLIGTAAMLGIFWLRERATPEPWVIIMSVAVMALIALSSLSDKAMRESEEAGDAILLCAQWRADRECAEDDAEGEAAE